MSDPARKPRIRGTTRRPTLQAEARKLRKLDSTFQTIMAGIEVDPTKAVMETRQVLARLLVSFMRNEGLTIPKRSSLFELWVAARPAFGNRERFDPEDSIAHRVKDLVMAMEPLVVSELAPLPNNGCYLGWCGRPKTFHTEEARLIALLGHVAAAFVISVGHDNAYSRFMGHDLPPQRTLRSDCATPVTPVRARPSFVVSLSRLLTRVFKWPVSRPGTPKPSAVTPIPAGEPAAEANSDVHFDPEEIPF